uniref:Uncharacterized protein n=1 Tax=Physcomitrium patens TaxID=3218 RepID=A0A2K1IGA1_PHYPA|nr:hypothetical protein PHYPA_028890 [Physcomitrium patens]
MPDTLPHASTWTADQQLTNLPVGFRQSDGIDRPKKLSSFNIQSSPESMPSKQFSSLPSII